MARKCPDCGRTLKKGEICDCKKQLIDDETKERVFAIMEGMITKPADTMKSFAKKSNFGFSIVIVAILSFITGLFVMSLSKNFYILSLQETAFVNFEFLSSIPYTKIFFGSCFMVFAFSFIYTFILFSVNTLIFKRECDYRIVYSLYGAKSIITLFTLLVSMVLLYINVYLGVILVIFGLLLSFVYGYQGIKYLGSKDENKYGYIYLSTYALFLLVIYLLYKIFS